MIELYFLHLYLVYTTELNIFVLEQMWFCFLFLQLNADIYDSDPELEKIRNDQGYSYMDIITIQKETLPNYEEKVCEALSPKFTFMWFVRSKVEKLDGFTWLVPAS